MATDLIRELVNRLVAEDVHLYVDGSELKYRARKGAIREADKRRVKAHKTAIIDYLSKLQQIEAATPVALPPLERVERSSQGLALSYGQQRLWFIDQLEHGSAHYNTQSTLFIGGELDTAALEDAFSDLLDRHEILRTCYVDFGGKPRQVVQERRSPALTYRYSTAVRDQDKHAQIRRWMQDDVSAAFDLSKDLMVRASVITLAAEAHLLVVTIHHIATDGWSAEILEREIRELYDARRSGRPARLRPLRVQYADYAVWQRGWLREGGLKSQLEYWKERLRGAPLVHSLPLDKARPSRQTFTGKVLQRSIGGEAAKAIRAVCDAEGVTLFMLMQTAFAVLLGRYSCQKDVVMGVTVAGRIHHDLESMIGLFMNLLVLRTDLSGKPTFRELLQRNRKVILEAHENQHVPFERIVEEVCPERNLSHNALVQILFGLQNQQQAPLEMPAGRSNGNANGHGSGNGSGNGGGAGNSGAGAFPSGRDLAPVSTRYDLKLDVLEAPDGLVLAWLYNDSLFADESLERLAASYEVLLSSIVDDFIAGAHSGRSIDSLDLVGTATRNELVAQENLRARRGGLVHGLFEAEAARNPGAVAVLQESLQLTYEELNERANRLAHLLLKRGVRPDGFVVLSVKRSVDMIVGLLAILKAGGAYVPVDPDLPEARVSYLLSDCEPLLVLSHTAFRKKFSIDESRIVCLDDAATFEQLQECARSNPEIADELLSPKNLAYAIYTSGSTGKPKGVLVSHENVCDFLLHAVEAFLPDHVAGAVVSSPLSFDATVGSLLVPLCGGRYAELLPDDAFVLDRLCDRLSSREEAMLFKLTPSHLEAMSAQGYMKANPGGQHVLVVAGEPLLPATLAHWSFDLLPSSLFINEYGPTETTVGSTTHPVHRPQDYAEDKAISVPIGKAFGDMQLYVLNDELGLQCPGGIGELFIGGAGVARGYLNRSALTAERFLPNPFSAHPGSRFYRSGDLARRLPDGSFEYVGRVDYQVKVRGIRVEPGEIEAHLVQLQEVAEAVVLAQSGVGEGLHLTAYMVVARGESADTSDDASLKVRIKDQLSRLLPAYMVPDVYVLLDKLPLNSNGKVDRNALAAATDDDLVRETYVPPSTRIEEQLCLLWQALLKVERVGIFDNFFSIGGHSLLATRLVSAIRHEFGVEIELRALFETPTVAALSKLLASAEEGSALQAFERVSRVQPLPLSFSQQRLWFIDQLGQGSAQYNMPGCFTVRGPFRQDAFQKALKSLLDRHEVLRTRFATVDGQARQVIVENYELPFTHNDLAELADGQKTAEAQRLLQEEVARPFDLGADLMLRARCLRWAEDVHLIVFVMHHIASDGWSRAILQRELSMLYAAYCKDEPNPLPPLAIQYADYAVWQRKRLQGKVLEEGLSYWRRQLADMPPLHGLPLDKPRPAIQGHVGGTRELLIGPELAAGIARLNRQHNTTLFMFMHTALAVLLSRCSGEQDIAIGSAITLRTHRDVEGLIGFFINDLVLRIKLDGARGFSELLKEHKETILDAYAHQHIPFEMLVEELNPPRSMSYEPLFQIKLDMRDNEQTTLSLMDLEVLDNLGPETPGERVGVRYDLHVSVSELKNGLLLNWRYNTDLFLPETIARLSSHFRTLLEGIVAAAEQPVHSLPLLTKAQEQRLLNAGQGPQAAYAQGKCIHELFEEQAERSPDEAAVVARDGSLTFQQLNREANRLAHYLLAHGVGPGSRVALCAERSLDMVVGVLGILKAGAAYLPLDPAHPPARLQYMLEDSGCRWVLTQAALQSSVPWGERKVLPIDAELRAPLLKDYGEDNPKIEGRGLTPRQLAYVIYTSGSTGQPKGVMVEHDGVVRYCTYARQCYYGADLAGSLLATSYGFDLTVPALYLPLLAGGHVRLLEEGRELEELAEMLASEQRPYLLRLTPSHVTGILPLLAGRQSACAHALVIGGEALPVAVVDALRACLPRARIYNHYGPTESIVGCSLLPLPEGTGAESSGYYPIGKPMAHKQLLVLSPDMQLQPQGTPGQLYVSGDGLARGYLGQPALTAQKFRCNPFSASAGARLYETGDLVRWRPDGNLEFLGRLDQQVKVRGLRIELGEIEQGLLGQPGVRECAVTVSGVGEEQRLVAYVVPEEDPGQGAEDDAALVQRKERLIGGYQEALASRLPAYMVPQAYVFLSRLPLTVNGKLDREALPAPEKGDLLKARYVAPRNATEERMCVLWQDVLKVRRVGIEDDFFLLGGHSLLATRLVNLIRQEFETELPLRALFESPTVASLSKRLGIVRKESAPPPLTPVPRDQPLPLSFAQQRLWFIDRLGQGSTQYNMPGSFWLGSLNVGAFERALQSLMERHEVLRTNYVEEGGEPRQVIAGQYAPRLQVHDLSGLRGIEIGREAERLMMEEARTPFDLSRDLMLRVRVLKFTDSVHVILYTTHHIATDGWSRGIFTRELTALYRAYCSGRDNPLEPLSIQYADYAQWQRRCLQGEVLGKQLSYWRKQLEGLPSLLKLPIDQPRPPVQTFRGRRERFVVPEGLAGKLQALSGNHGATLFMTLLGAFAVVLGRYSGQQDVAVGTPIANRTRSETEGLIGYFANTLVTRHDLSGDPSFVDFLKRTREMALEAYAHQDVPFERLVEELNPQRNLSHSPLFQVMFILQNMPFEEFDANGPEAQPPWNEDAGEQVEERAPEVTVRFDLTLSVRESATGLMFALQYNMDLFERRTIQRLVGHYERLLNAIVDAPQARLSQLEILSEEERRRQLVEWNATAHAYPRNKCIHELFEEQARQRPDAVALVHEARELTYGELNRRANRLAHQLIERGVGPEGRVGLCMQRSPEMVIGMLGILKAGGCYVPLDAEHPRKRIEYLIEDAKIDIVVADASVATLVAGLGRDLLFLNEADALEPPARWTLQDLDSEALGLCPDHPAYLIYTSASTGAPKGVLGLHRSIVNRVNWLAGALEVGAEEVLCQKTSVGFVDHVAEIFQALSAGVPLVIIPSALLRTPREWLRALDARRVTRMTLVPSLLRTVIEAAEGESARWIRSIHSSGEALHLSGLEKIGQCFPRARLFNIYGSTEVGADVTFQEVQTGSLRAQETGHWALIGKGIDNAQAYILDADGRLAVPGAVGELHIGGAGLARGYLNRAGLTAERFIPHPFSKEPGERIYRTGDLARWRTDGTLQYVGRTDHQVKVRGFRIEIGEIENVLRAQGDVRDAVVVVRDGESESKRLVGYVVPSSGAAADAAALVNALRSRLQEQLPGYMVPSALVVLESLPLTTNGKVDRQALPAPEADLAKAAYVAPRDEFERQLCEVWQELLKLERVGIQDNFFELGGHSLLVIKLGTRILETTGMSVTAMDLYANPTIASFADSMNKVAATTG